MPTTRVRTPTGEVIQVEHPEGATDDEILSFAQQQFSPQLELPAENLPAAGAAGASRGVLGTLDIVPRGLAGLANALLNTQWQGQPFSSAGAALGLGTFQPRTPAEEKAAFTGEVVGASVLPGVGAVSRAAAPARALLTETAAAGGAAGGGLVGGELGGQPGQVLGTLAGGLTPMAAPWMARTLISPMGQAQMPDVLAAAQRQGVPITAGQAAGGSALEKASATLPGGGRTAEKFREQQSTAMRGRVDELIRQLTAREPSSEAAGRAINQGLEAWTDRFRSTGEQLYGRLGEMIPPTTPVRLDTLQTRLNRLVMSEDFSSILDAPLVRQLATRIGETGPTTTYETARAIRSRIGEKLSSPELIADAPTGQLKQLYAALSDDLETVAEATGPEALRAFRDANRYWRAGQKRIDEFLDPIRKRNVPENVYRAALQGTPEGASRIRALKRSLDPEQWRVVVATTLNRLGRARPSERTTGTITEEATDFSPETFLTNVDRMDSKARQVLFSGTRYEGLESNLQDLQTVAQAIRAQRQVLYNPSGTAGAFYNAAGLAAPLAAFPFNPALGLQAGAGMVANVGLQRALQSPSIVNYLANPTQFSPALLPQLTRYVVSGSSSDTR